VAADAHAAAGAERVVRGAGAVGDVEVALGDEGARVLEVGVVVVGGVGVHIEGRARGEGGAVPGDGHDGHARQADGEDGPEAQGLLDERGDVGHFFLMQALLPRIVVGVDGEDFSVGALLDLLAVGG